MMMTREQIAQEIARLNIALGQQPGGAPPAEMVHFFTGGITPAQQALYDERDWWEKAARLLWEAEQAITQARAYQSAPDA